VQLNIKCSKGTYIRSLARDIGEALNSGAYLSKLTRTQIGEYHIDNAMDPFDFEKKTEKTKQI
ncbi:MAG: tRNA pseudouridine(55) synthase, partial [Bacteroidota bacterium]|nr:tRNA pseudouridine(55) synthase [Bacteroidota bacterium]